VVRELSPRIAQRRDEELRPRIDCRQLRMYDWKKFYLSREALDGGFEHQREHDFRSMNLWTVTAS